MKVTKRSLRKIIREFIEDIDLENISLDFAPEKKQPRVMGNGGNAKMTRSQLFHIAKNSQSLHDKLKDEDQLPNWAQAKITISKSMLDSVYDYLDYKMHRQDVE